MEALITFLTDFVSWNALIWLMIGAGSIVAVRLVHYFIGRNLHELMILLHGFAATCGFIVWFINHLLGNVIMPVETTWWDALLNTCTVQSIYINLLVLIVHFYFHVRPSRRSRIAARSSRAD